MKSLTFFFRHPHQIYFSMEKLFHAVADKISGQQNPEFSVKEINLPFTSSLTTIRRNISFVGQSQSLINHITGDVQYAILGCDKKNINVITVHDCVLLYHYSKYNPRFWIIRWLWYRLPVKKADAVTVISENTKRDLLHFTDCDARKIHVIPNFIDPAFTESHKDFAPNNPSILFIGTAPNKNLERTIDALSGLSIQLVIVGYISEKQKTQLKNSNIQYRVLNKLSDQQMRSAYAEADIILFPSTYEGFGLPIIEAQATGRPVITSHLEPMHFVAGEAACFVDPFKVASIREGVEKLIAKASYRDELIRKGFENIKRFQLDNVAKQYSDLYLKLLNARKN